LLAHLDHQHIADRAGDGGAQRQHQSQQEMAIAAVQDLIPCAMIDW
jgi:hypothetical protein